MIICVSDLSCGEQEAEALFSSAIIFVHKWDIYLKFENRKLPKEGEGQVYKKVII